MPSTAAPAATLSSKDALALRMRSLLLHAPDEAEARARWDAARADVASVVTWFGAMQAQDLGSGLWSFGARLPQLTKAEIEAQLEARAALRTWPMRGTVHFVPARDAAWMVRILGERPLAAAAKRRAVIGLDEAVADRAVDVLGEALAGGGRLTRAQCLEALVKDGIDLPGNHGYHLLWYASQRGVTCIAPNLGSEQTFVLLEEWVPDQHEPGREEALATIAVRFVRSHGPVPRSDLVGWTGLTAADVRAGLAAAGEAVAAVDVDGAEMYIAPEALDGDGPAGSPGAAAGTRRRRAPAVLALPGFDEYLLGYKDRSLMVEDAHKQAIIPGNNGIFQATIVRDGRVIGLWKRTTGKRRTVVDVTLLADASARDRARVEKAFEPYARYLGVPVEVRFAG